MRNVPAGDFLDLAEQLRDGRALACSEVQGNRFAASLQVFDRPAVRGAQVHDMDKVANTGAIRRIQVVAEDGQGLRGDERGLQGERNQVRLGGVNLADLAARIGTRGVEVSQGDIAQAVRAAIGREHPFHQELGGSRG
jgi:hypothetical protein